MAINTLTHRFEEFKKMIPASVLSLAIFPLVGQQPLHADSVVSNKHDSSANHTKPVTSQLNQSEKQRALYWGLSTAEWLRYRSLMQGIRGSVSPATLSPIEVLGIHARSEAERAQYAERWAMMMRADASRILAFQQAYDTAHRRLFAGEPLIDQRVLDQQRDILSESEKEELDASDRLLFFTNSDCVACDVIFERLLKKLPEIAGIDVYLTDIAKGQEQAIRDWAKAWDIDPEWVRTRRLTLNFEAGARQSIANQIGQPLDQIPTIVRRRADYFRIIKSATLE